MIWSIDLFPTGLGNQENILLTEDEWFVAWDELTLEMEQSYGGYTQSYHKVMVF